MSATTASATIEGAIARREPPSSAGSRAGTLAARGLLIGMATLPAWLFGGVLPGAIGLLAAAAVVVLACGLLVQGSSRARGMVLPAAVLPLLCALGLGALQLVPLNAPTLNVLSPSAVRLRSTLAPADSRDERALSGATGQAPAGPRQPLSLCPAATRHDLALLATASAVFLGGALFFRTAAAQMWLCGALALNGAALAFFELTQLITTGPTWRLLWTEQGSPTVPGLGWRLGPLVGRNNDGGLLNLCLGAAVALVLWSAARGRSGARGRVELRIVALSLTSLIVAGVFCTFSRGAAGAMLVAGALIAALLGLRRGLPRLGWIALAAVAGASLVGWLGMSGALQARYATLLDPSTLSQGRLPNWQDALHAVPDFWGTGSGLGTYRYVYSLYQDRLDPAWYYHAENQPLEALVDGGVAGLGLLLAAAALVAWACWRLLQHAGTGRMFAFAVGATFAVAAQFVHACCDFGLYIPANAMVFALLSGAVAGAAAGLPGGARAVSPGPSWRGRLAAALATSLLLGASLWGFSESARAAPVEAAVRASRQIATDANTPPAALTAAIDRLSAALAHCPDEPEGQARLAELWIDLYRVRALDALRQENPAGVNDRQRWELTSPLVIHARAWAMARSPDAGKLEQLRAQPLVRGHLLPALGSALSARGACPLLARVHLAIGALCGLAAAPSSDAAHLERAERLGRGNPHLLLDCGLLELQAGRTERACDDWRRTLSASAEPRWEHFDDVLTVAAEQLPAWQIVERLLPDSPSVLERVGRQRYAGPEQGAMRSALGARIEGALEQSGLAADDQDYYRGLACAWQERPVEAIESYRRALEGRPRAAEWRYELAVLLRDQGRQREAYEQARMCVQWEPTSVRYRALLQEIHGQAPARAQK